MFFLKVCAVCYIVSLWFDRQMECYKVFGDTTLPSSFVQIWSADCRDSMIIVGENKSDYYVSFLILFNYLLHDQMESLIQKQKAVISWQNPVEALWHLHIWTHACELRWPGQKDWLPVVVFCFASLFRISQLRRIFHLLQIIKQFPFKAIKLDQGVQNCSVRPQILNLVQYLAGITAAVSHF